MTLSEFFKKVGEYKSSEPEPKNAYERGLRHGWADAMKFASEVAGE